MMNETAFFTAHPLPVFEYLSPDSKRQLEAYLADGNTAFRQKRLLEFFKMLDWDYDPEPLQERLLQKLKPGLRRQLNREIQDYYARKAAARADNAEKREQYKRRIIEYFRSRIPAADKILLESLRDYELDLTGRDVNFRHYFTLDSFKKIDAFVQADAAERQALFARFKQDVETYKKNYEKIHQAQAARACEHVFSFDDWCELMGETESFKTASGGAQSHRQAAQMAIANPVLQAFQTLQVSAGTAPDAVKKQFRKLTLQYHPDLPNGSEEKMKALVGAYQEVQRYWQRSRL